jgi:CubicO group peptidase (beta-lactamase class C family)
MGTFAANKPLAHPPGSHWSYSSGTTNLIAWLHRRTFDELGDYLAFPRRRLFDPLGMASALIEPDASGTFVGSSYMYATPRDWARLGLLYLRDGVWNGTRLLPAGWVDYSLTPAPAAPKGEYGAQIWLNRGTGTDGADRPHPELPRDMFYLSGFEGQNVVVVPSADLIVVRLGLTRSGESPVWALTRRILDAVN